MTHFYDLGMDALPLFEVAEVREGLENERESVVVWKNGVLVHLGVDRN